LLCKDDFYAASRGFDSKKSAHVCAFYSMQTLVE
jgi:hypothetical protein